MKKIPGLAPLLALTLFAASLPGTADAAHVQPSSMFVQGGSWSHVESATVGMTWDWQWQREFDAGTVTGYTELDLARWRTRGRPQDEGFNQFGISPVVRFYPSAIGHGWYAEGGIGPNWITPRYHNGGHTFSTTFNFGDRIAIGRQFGQDKSQEVSLGFEHFSNASIKKPNPGENFVQLRYAHRF